MKMIFPTYFGLFLLCLSQSIEISRADWKYPPFTRPEPMEDVVRSFEFNNRSNRAEIALEEEVNHTVCIAVIDYDGTATPLVGPLDENKNNFILGAEPILNSTTGKWSLWITKKQDYETLLMRSYRFPIIIGSTQNTIALNIINIDDNPPVIQANERNCRIEENYAGESNCTYVVSDADGFTLSGVPAITLTVTPDDKMKHFEFVTSKVSGDRADYQLSASLNVIESLDFESISMFSVFIRAVDKGGNEGNLSTVVEVIDMPDEPPMWTTLTAAENILEKSTRTFPVRAIDGDIQINAEINYRIESVYNARDEEFFEVNQTTGDITIKPIDRDELQKEIFRFLIVAYEVPEPDSQINATITIIVEDINDHIPTITPDVLTIEIDEEKYTTLEFDPSIAITDPDLAENAQFTVSLVDQSKQNWSLAFLVVPTSGYQQGIFTISVINASLLDYEDPDWRVIDLELRAVEKANASHIGTKNIHIELRNWNDELPIFDETTPTEVSVKEDVEMNYFVATMHATDRDVDDNVTHSLVAHGLMIDRESGNVTTSQNDAFDYESMPVVLVQVVATDLAAHKTYATLTINVIDVNDVPPKLYLPREVPSLVEEEPTMTEVKTVINATDVDTDADLIFSIDWDNSRAHKSSVPVDESLYRGHLEIRTDWPLGHKRYAEGTLYIAGRIDYEAFDVMFLTISVTDRKTVHNENTTSASLTLNIVDINDNTPIFAEIEAKSVVENQVADTLIGAPVTATDADGPMYNKVSYYIQPINGTKDGLISINQTTGAIRTKDNEAIDAEEYEYIYYNVTATDGLNNETKQISIYVIDVNDEVPYLLPDKFNATIYIPEKSPNGTEIVTIFANDNDRTSPFNNISYLINTEYSAAMQYFSMGRFDGFLQVNLTDGHKLDRDFGTPMFNLSLKLRDNYLDDGVEYNSNAIDTTVRVILLDINDQKPLLPDKGETAVAVSESRRKGDLLLDVVADDRDDDTTINTKVFYELRGIAPAHGTVVKLREECEKLFVVETVQQKTAKIQANCDLRGYYGRWEIELYAQDLGVNPGPQNHTRNYTIQITDFNYHDPVIEFPPNGRSISLNEKQAIGERLRTYDNQLLNDFNATDEDHGNSGMVTFTLSSKNGDHEYFEIVSISKNVERLRLTKAVNVDEKKKYETILTATDNGDPPRSTQQELNLMFVSAKGPEFDVSEWTVWIKENKTGLEFSTIIGPEASDMLGDASGNIIVIYYFFTNEADNDMKHFGLDKSNRNLTVKEELDREKQEIMTLYVVATTSKDSPPGNPSTNAVLKVIVVVLDVNDNAPIFQKKPDSAGIAMEDAVDKVVLTVKATDADLNDTLTYSIVPDSMTTSDSSLAGIPEPFIVDPESGELSLKFSPTSNMKGSFRFDMVVNDAVDHTDTITVTIHVIEKKNRVVFTFNNVASYVKEQQIFIIDSFKSAFGYTCNIDDIKTAVGDDGRIRDNVTTLTTHFINNEDNPVDSDTIVQSSNDLQTITNLKIALLTKSLRLIDVPTGSTTAISDMQQTVHWLLVSATIFFCLCTITLLVVFVLRTKRLTQRLDKLAFTKYDSHESGLDRAGIVPTTNQFATAGSNPIWNTNEKTVDDNVSQGSGDSDLIGIEDNPDFGYVNGVFASDDRWEKLRGGSFNPALANDGPISQSLFDRVSYPEDEKKNIF